ncbi:hypothetical protein SAMN05421780_104246 [Flexibacter flexilis DSM 6793]|uniref:Uncharacterized protein n=1 Tax=Flexibacter flexilis DSM 6793 TaxID=927664 RepID=A0A1I1I7U2_9BACT|nr:hypothetical protein [Flexibacter flexilis]SFC32131.1 hypothetical protein SAMN05421780_104246 [Flexibacter flexilis DSM 6793]
MKSLLTFVFVLSATLAWAGVNTACSSAQAQQPSQTSKQSKQVLACAPALKATKVQKEKGNDKTKNNVEVAPVANEKPLEFEIPELPVPAEAKPQKKQTRKSQQPSILPLMMCSPALLNRLYTEKPSEG